MRRKRYGIRKRKKRSPKYYTIKRLLGSRISRPYKDKNRLMLGSGNKLYKQTGGFFSVSSCTYCRTSSD